MTNLIAAAPAVPPLPRFVTLRDHAVAITSELAADQVQGECVDDGATFTPTADQLATLEAFKARFNAATCKKRGFRDWKEALYVAWHQGWDDRCEGGHHLRQMRNTAGAHEWLQEQPVK